MYGRVFFDYEAKRNSKLIPFNWSEDRAKSFENFMECFYAWEQRAKTDLSVDLVQEFNITALPKFGPK